MSVRTTMVRSERRRRVQHSVGGRPWRRVQAQAGTSMSNPCKEEGCMSFRQQELRGIGLSSARPCVMGPCSGAHRFPSKQPNRGPLGAAHAAWPPVPCALLCAATGAIAGRVPKNLSAAGRGPPCPLSLFGSRFQFVRGSWLQHSRAAGVPMGTPTTGWAGHTGCRCVLLAPF